MKTNIKIYSKKSNFIYMKKTFFKKDFEKNK